MTETRAREKQRQQNKGQTSGGITRFGDSNREADWIQWTEFVILLDDPHAFDDEKEEPEDG